MALRIRSDGRVLCAAMHGEEPGDTYLDDGVHYLLSVEKKLLVTEPNERHFLWVALDLSARRGSVSLVVRPYRARFDCNAWDDERNKTNPQPGIFIYTKTVVTTNKVEPFSFPAGDRRVELGLREDGVVVWRNRE